MTDAIPIQNEHVAYTIVDGSAVIVSPKDSKLYWLNDVATQIWKLADGNRSVGVIAEELCTEYEVDATTALRDAAEMVEAFGAKNMFKFSGAESDA